MVFAALLFLTVQFAIRSIIALEMVSVGPTPTTVKIIANVTLVLLGLVLIALFPFAAISLIVMDVPQTLLVVGVVLPKPVFKEIKPIFPQALNVDNGPITIALVTLLAKMELVCVVNVNALLDLLVKIVPIKLIALAILFPLANLFPNLMFAMFVVEMEALVLVVMEFPMVKNMMLVVFVVVMVLNAGTVVDLQSLVKLVPNPRIAFGAQNLLIKMWDKELLV